MCCLVFSRDGIVTGHLPNLLDVSAGTRRGPGGQFSFRQITEKDGELGRYIFRLYRVFTRCT